MIRSATITVTTGPNSWRSGAVLSGRESLAGREALTNVPEKRSQTKDP